MKIITFALLLIFVSCKQIDNDSSLHKKGESEIISSDTTFAQDMAIVDSAKWYLYLYYGNLYCDESSNQGLNNKSLSKRLGFYDIVVKEVQMSQNRDTATVKLYFDLGNDNYCFGVDSGRFYSNLIPRGFQFSIPENKLIGLIFTRDNLSAKGNIFTYENTSEIKYLLANNKSEFNAWFISEAIKKGLVKEN